MVKVATIIRNNKKCKIFFDENGNFSRIRTGVCNFKYISNKDKEMYQNILHTLCVRNSDILSNLSNTKVGLPILGMEKGVYNIKFRVDEYIIYIYGKTKDEIIENIRHILEWSKTV